jgi:hypothetical protein
MHGLCVEKRIIIALAKKYFFKTEKCLPGLGSSVNTVYGFHVRNSFFTFYALGGIVVDKLLVITRLRKQLGTCRGWVYFFRGMSK